MTTGHTMVRIFLISTVITLLPSCSELKQAFRSECVEYRNKSHTVSRCVRYDSNLTTHCIDERMVEVTNAVCVRSECRPGYQDYFGKCYTTDELKQILADNAAEERRRASIAIAERIAERIKALTKNTNTVDNDNDFRLIARRAVEDVAGQVAPKYRKFSIQDSKIVSFGDGRLFCGTVRLTTRDGKQVKDKFIAGFEDALLVGYGGWGDNPHLPKSCL